ncbi:TRAP transporter substrate-binding protein DctP [Gloeocapsa sp. PCC 73106]|uniref:TRAP transporter substrate-binding protein DctP n=1 Tax=Gloeocapsa sp. PCC 73106 TaxID=102232 RepID=UPI0002AC2ABB|nr:TRAP transporter substrate-binding protein DctP [Gloeocapsa sp. PCC 73106]ELS00148.1 TRAP-type mannitol/chloroaromatic compound transport system, periplasmic component [Gloeocapsa sp. PCC 73106]
MKRRVIIKRLSEGAIAATGVGIVGGCQNANNQSSESSTAADDLPTINWQMATSWPISLETIFGGAQVLADRVKALTNGKFIIEPRAAGEIAPGLEVLDVVSQGAVQSGHTASYYYIGKSPALAFGTSVPFGLNAQQQNAWLYQGGGLAKLQEIYATKFNVIQFPAGNTGTQMGGWFRQEVNNIDDLKGLKMRIPGLGGQVMAKLGVTVQTLPGGEIFQALQTGAIDAAEWVGPYDDEKLGLNKVAKFYYYPGWWEPGATLEVQINLNEWNKLPPQYQAAIETAAFESNMTMLAIYDTRNSEALERLLQSGTQVRPYSQEILAAAEKAALALYDEFAAQDTDFQAVYKQWRQFKERIYSWHNLNEGSFSRYTYDKLKVK